jgi:hypothetical protein
MAYHQGQFKPTNPDKYVGDPNNITYRSGWEAKFCRYLDRHPDILQWQSEEVVVPYFYPIDQRVHRYFPDFLVKKRNPDGTHSIIMIEIKPERETLPPQQTKNKTRRRMLTEAATYIKNKAKWEAAKRYCKERGWEFKILTEKHIGVLKG